MKKIRFFTIIITLIFVSIFSCFAQTYKEGLKTSLDLEGFVAIQHSVTITELKETGSLGYGTPFDITGDDVKYNATNQNLGRRIATWDFSSTWSTVTLTVKASPMVSEADSSVTLDYYISFKYKFATFDETGNYVSDTTGYILTCSTDTDGETTTFTNVTKKEHFPIIASSEQDIRFMFVDGIDTTSSYYPSGYYTATVTIEFVGE